MQSSAGAILLFSINALGFLLINLFYFSPHFRIHQQEPDCLLRLFISLVSLVILVGWIATSLAMLGIYELKWVAISLLAINGGFISIVLSRRLVQPGVKTTAEIPWHSPWRKLSANFCRDLLAVRFQCKGNWNELALTILVLISAGLYLHPHEYVLGGNDAGSYINIAAATARTGTYLQRDEWNLFLAEHGAATLRTQPRPMLTRHLQFVGWYIDDEDPAISRPQFFPYHPSLLSIAMSIGGVRAGFYVTPLVAILGIVALYLLARQLFNEWVALLAASFLTITSTQIFFARYPTTEPLTMLLLFAGFLAFQVLWDEATPSPLWGAFGGAALGSALLTRIDLPLVLAMVMAGLIWLAWQRRWHLGWSAFALVLLAFALQMFLIIWFFTWPYFWNTYRAVYGLVIRSSWLLIGTALSALVVCLAALLLGPRRFQDRLQRLKHSASVRWILGVGIIALSLYAYFLRPILEPTRIITSWPGNVEVPLLNGQNWLRMGWYITPLGIALATIGLAMILIRERLARLTIVLGIGVLTTVQYVYNIMNMPYHIYTMRRYVPIVIPMLWICAAYAIVALPRFFRPWMTLAVRGILVAALVGGLVYQDRYVVRARDYAGSLTQLYELHQQLQTDAILLFAEPGESTFSDAFGVPLHSIFGHPIATIRTGNRASEEDTSAASLQHERAVVEFLEALLMRAKAQKRPVQLLAVDPIPATVRNHLTLQPSGYYDFTTQMLMNTFDAFPSVTQTIHYGIEIYDVAPPDSMQLAQESITVDIGSMDGAYLDDGFWGKEYIPGAPSMRWTQAVATLTLPLPAPSDGPGWEIQIRAMIYRPDGIEPTDVIVRAGNHTIGSFIPTEEWTTYTFQVEATDLESPDSIQLQFIATPFVPAELGLNNDQRQLGFLLDWIKITPSTWTR
ncbi:glycosyltransferase family 39 protein [Litorilinea aerophila]|uniref:Glycosyltransferase family 39 protein n=1 Tax=Litorilinea aerophila TaxID=1204385 RepID=A0A540VJA4_9CHLR|nr:glycosyltransferase family 39 protein [Litorilinea aerophila]MCC9075708.1 glycosyltransferase family 39 protein [Litorilinea aerophila]